MDDAGLREPRRPSGRQDQFPLRAILASRQAVGKSGKQGDLNCLVQSVRALRSIRPVVGDRSDLARSPIDGPCGARIHAHRGEPARIEVCIFGLAEPLDELEHVGGTAGVDPATAPAAEIRASGSPNVAF